MFQHKFICVCFVTKPRCCLPASVLCCKYLLLPRLVLPTPLIIASFDVHFYLKFHSLDIIDAGNTWIFIVYVQGRERSALSLQHIQQLLEPLPAECYKTHLPPRYIHFQIIPMVFVKNHHNEVLFYSYLVSIWLIFIMAFWYIHTIRLCALHHLLPYTLPLLLPLLHPNSSLCFHISHIS